MATFEADSKRSDSQNCDSEVTDIGILPEDNTEPEEIYLHTKEKLAEIDYKYKNEDNPQDKATIVDRGSPVFPDKNF